MQESVFNKGLYDFLEASPTPFHAVQTMTDSLRQVGFSQIVESDQWDLLNKGRYFVTRGGSSIIAFTLGESQLEHTGIRMVGAHTDSPCLRVKPSPVISKNGYIQLGVQVYGGALLSPWFDRDLSLAGRVSYLADNQKINHKNIDFKTPIAVIPSLAIHLNRDVHKKRSINSQIELTPVLLHSSSEQPFEFDALLLEQLKKQHSGTNATKILAYELSFYDVQPPAFVGLKSEFIASARLDNLLSCYVGLKSILEADSSISSLLICNDHEEVGSVSAYGACGPFLKSVLERICKSSEKLTRTLDHSMLISTDNAHGIHPNYASKHDENHGPILNQGPVLKVNANQRYASESTTSAIFKYLCDRVQVPVQNYVVRNDMACGSTIGPLTAGTIGVKTVDVGVPTFAMHSIRELAGRLDGFYLYKVLREFFTRTDMDLS